MAKIEFETGSNPKIRGEFRTPKSAIPPNTLIDPSILTLTIRKPDKTTAVFVFGGTDDIVKLSTGIYQYTLPLTQQGTYHWRWRAENGLEAGVITGTLDSVLEPNF